MTFKNEYIPPIEEETSEFFKKAREVLCKGHPEYTSWTIDRLNSGALMWTSGGREFETRHDDSWKYFNQTGLYIFDTRLDGSNEISPRELEQTRTILRFWKQDYTAGMPSAETLSQIKAALQSHKEGGVLSVYETCRLTLILQGETV